MYQLAYISSACGEIDRPLLENILAVSRRNNQRDGITGLLVSGGRRFLQALEGPEAKVLTAYARIQADPRHRACVLLTSRATPTRQFGDWSMAFHGGGSSHDENLTAQVEALVAQIDDPNLRAQFAGFAQLHDRAA